MKPEKLAPLLFVLSALVLFGISWLTRSSLPISKQSSRLLGGAIFLLGMVAFTWVVVFLKAAFLGEVAPVTDHLVTNGPYRWIRHPLYLSMIITLLGITLALRSLWGIGAIFALFLPAVVYRAKLEEEALAQKFGQNWDEYAIHTTFLLPWLW